MHQTAVHLTEVVVQAEKMQGPGEARHIVRQCSRMRGLHERWSAEGSRAALDARYRRLAEMRSSVMSV